ncbi:MULTISPECIES: peptidoglycan DD-metalloendopeptidase family protein [Prevotellaceae]|uniref:M23/M37 family peptidase n=2 Tax=Prevotellaceae TaxID=171552 RepID=F9D2H5_PREDD|nr:MULTISPECIES: peptidoglycan DD-metalloendopeptidase family protein [Prevotellaceae]AGB28466.1 metalloendopeptidase-like membrane protein [Prevotella dentalis DSM 3688]EGQ15638.1 M23/M37 family peptidase [Prevotella dentalis DSM 3688]
MTFKTTIKTLALSLLFALAAEPVCGQDLLARQAPVDRRAKKLDSIEVRAFVEKENLQSPAAQLYGDDWDNRYAHRTTELPDSFVINLRHFCMPTPSRVVTSNFGSRWGRQHKGLDIKVYIGDTIRAAFSGKVRVVRYEGRGYGNYIVIRHPNGLETIYGHLSKQLVTENQNVRVGEPIGLGGNTGRSTGSHLHFETRLCGVALNPALFFDFRNQDVVADQYVFNKATYERESDVATRERGKVGNGGYTRDQIYGEVGHSEETASTAVRNAANVPERVYYKVLKGDTLESIAKKCGVTVDVICRLNGYRKNQTVRPGQIIRYV